MSDCIDDYNSMISLIIDEYQNLSKLNSKNPLLKLIRGVDDNGFEITRSFNKRYGGIGNNHISERGKFTAKGCAYLKNLRDEVTDKLMELLSREKGKDEAEIWKKMEEEGFDRIIRTHLTHNQHQLMNFVK